MERNYFQRMVEKELGEDTNKDNVNPNHYKVGGLQPIEVFEIKMSKEQFKGFLMGNVMKYVMRHEHKNGVEDLQKAQWYLKKMVDTYEMEGN